MLVYVASVISAKHKYMKCHHCMLHIYTLSSHGGHIQLILRLVLMYMVHQDGSTSFTIQGSDACNCSGSIAGFLMPNLFRVLTCVYYIPIYVGSLPEQET